MPAAAVVFAATGALLVGEDTEALVTKVADIAARAPGVAKAHGLTRAESEHMLEPWLGEGVDLSQLPIPRLIVVEMSARERADLAPLKGMPLTHIWCDLKAERDAEILRSLKTLEMINGKSAAEFWREVDQKKP